MTNAKRLQGNVCLLYLVLLAVSAHLEALIRERILRLQEFLGESEDKDNQHRRSKRSLSQLATMISCATKNNWMDYSNYGCYCGPGGQGRPVDEVDRCCQKHDKCYNQVMSSTKCMISLEVYFISYQVTKCFHCRPSYSPCSSAICRCDSKLAKCLQNKKLQKRYELYDQTKCSQSF